MRILILIIYCTLIMGFSKSALSFTNHGYPYTKTSGCTSICEPDDYNFCKNNCTSYVAYMLNSCGFNTAYRGVHWGDAGNWTNAAQSVEGQNIAVDNYPMPGDVAFWKYDWTGDGNDNEDNWGHVAWVEKVNYEINGNLKSIEVTEYNYTNECEFGERTITVNDRNYPDGFIHILAYEEGITSLFYLDCYEMECPEQTREEWEQMATRAWNIYRCKDCNSDYDVSILNPIGDGFGSGNPPDPEDGQSSGNDEDLVGSVSSSSSGSSSKPELFVKELSFRNGKTKYYDDENIHIDAYVKNAGKSVDPDIAEIAVKLFRFRGEKENGDTKEKGDENIKGENLESGVTKHEEFSTGAPDEENKYQFYAVVDAKNAVSESNEANNKSEVISCRVHNRPDIKVESLILSNERTLFYETEIPNAKATFTNSGGEPFIDVPVKWYLDEIHIADDNMRHWNIEHGDEKHEDINLPNLPLGTHTIKVCADFEDDEHKNDNCRSLVFQVAAAPSTNTLPNISSTPSPISQNPSSNIDDSSSGSDESNSSDNLNNLSDEDGDSGGGGCFLNCF